MRENVTNMDQELKLLRQNIELITTGSSRVNTSLVEKRNRINQLSNVHSLLRKVRGSATGTRKRSRFRRLTLGVHLVRAARCTDPIRV